LPASLCSLSQLVDTAKTQWRKVADQSAAQAARLAGRLDAAETDVLAYMTFSAAHRSKLHSTNSLEGLKREIKRRTEVHATPGRIVR
jgi:putative transposase